MDSSHKALASVIDKSMTTTPTTIDGILNHRVQLEQPRDGFRVAVDTVLLAASIPARVGEHVLELGAGVGGAMLCLAARIDGVVIEGVEVQPELAEICQRNIERNGKTAHLKIHTGDVALAPTLDHFDHAMMNPPYFDEAVHDTSPNPIKRAANSADGSELARWISIAVHSLKPNGNLTLIYRADAADHVATELKKHFSSVTRLDVLPKKDAPPKRVIFRAHNLNPLTASSSRKRGSSASDNEHESLLACGRRPLDSRLRRNDTDIIVAPPLILHNETGGYSDDAEDILRHIKSVSFGVE